MILRNTLPNYLTSDKLLEEMSFTDFFNSFCLFILTGNDVDFGLTTEVNCAR